MNSKVSTSNFTTIGLVALSLLVGGSLSRADEVDQTQLRNEPAYVPHELWPGILWVQTQQTLNSKAAGFLNDVLDDQRKALILRSEATVGPSSPVSQQLNDQLGDKIDFIAFEQMQSWLKKDDAEIEKALSDYSLLWIDSDTQLSEQLLKLENSSRIRLVNLLHQQLQANKIVGVSGNVNWLSKTIGLPHATLLQPEFMLRNINESARADNLKPECASIELHDNSCFALHRRWLISLQADPLKIRFASTESYDQEHDLTVALADMVDVTQLQRQWHERQQASFPDSQQYQHRLEAGSLVIGGGGALPREVLRRFIELAGGAKSKIIVLPTAVPNPTDELSAEFEILKRVGAENIKQLPQIELDQVSSEAYLRELREASGVWFCGGRQWRFVDAYAGTPAWKALKEVVSRGGVIGGSSAGATIQGDLLVRGAPAGNHIMIADGYRRGLGLVPGLAIDQHFQQRNRFRELETCLEPYPSIYGIGIDEGTALIMTAPNHCKVLGSGSVWAYPSQFRQSAQTRAAVRTEFQSGDQFELQ